MRPPGHGSAGLLARSCFIDAPRRFYVAGLIASVVIFLDLMPLYLGFGNPVPAARHAFPPTVAVAVVVIAAVAAASRRHLAVLAAAAAGLLIHSPGKSPRTRRRCGALAAF